MLAFRKLMAGAESVSEGACGQPGEATGPLSNECLQPDAKPSLFMRQVSPALSSASTALPSPPFAALDSCSPCSVPESPTDRHIPHFDLDFVAGDVGNERCEYEARKDGVLWTVTRGVPPSISQLGDHLAHVKALYKEKFGQDIDEEEADDDACDADGVRWTVTRGTPPSMAQLEDRLSDLKALYKTKFGEEFDSEEREDDDSNVEKDGVVWTVTRGTPPSMSRLEDRLSDVKALYKAKFGEDVDSEERQDDIVERDGVMWTVTRGAPPSMAQLEGLLSEVKALYKAKFGADVDSEERKDDEGDVEKDGVTWTVTRGAPPSLAQLEDRLLDVKALYNAKFGADVDSEEREDYNSNVEKDGVVWTVTRGAPPSMSQLEDRLSDVMALYKAKFGEDFDFEDREDDEGDVEKDGITWTITRGTPPSTSQLEDRLFDVKALYEAKYGEKVDAGEEQDDDVKGRTA